MSDDYKYEFHHNGAEQLSKQALDVISDDETLIQDTYLRLAKQAQSQTISSETKQILREEISSLQRASANLQTAQRKVSNMKDELSARLHDVEKSLDRKWYKANPPSNTYIDLAEQQEGHFAKGMNLYKLFIILFVGSFAGVVIELLWCFVRNGYFESRSGLVYGPFNMLYGIGAAAITAALYPFRNRGKWLSFLGGFLVGSVVEYACSWFLETAYGAASWDYSHMPFNLNGRICLLYSIFWGFLGVWWIKDLYPRMAKWVLKIPNKTGKVFSWVLVVFLIFNVAVSGLAVWRWSDRVHGKPSSNRLEAFLDQQFPDERMESVYANMSFSE